MRTRPYEVGDVLTDYGNVEITVQRIVSNSLNLLLFGPDARLSPGKWLAVKMMQPDLARRSDGVRVAFAREALTWRGIWPHANVTQAHFVTEIDGLPALVLDYAERGSLRTYLRPQPSYEAAFHWAQHILAGLRHLHTPDPAYLRPQVIVHRDLKPENILITEQGMAMITDFGLAATYQAIAAMTRSDTGDHRGSTTPTHTQVYRTRRGVAVGTLAYMAPEQWQDATQASPAADLYAFGLILGELFSGHHPLLEPAPGVGPQQWRVAHERGERRPLPADLPTAVQTLYTALLNPDPRARPASDEATQMLQDGARVAGLPIYEPSEVFAHTPADEVTFWRGWANAYTRFGEYAAARTCLDHAAALVPDDPHIALARAAILAKQGDFAAALAACDAALDAFTPGNADHRKMALHQKAAIYTEMGRFAEAEAAHKAALDLMPDAADSWHNRAVNMRRWGEAELQARLTDLAGGHLKLALDYARTAWDANPLAGNLPLLLARLGSNLQQAQCYAEAEHAFALAIVGDLGADEAAAWYNRAANMLYWGQADAQAEREEPALRHWRRAHDFARQAQSLAPDATDTQQLITVIEGILKQLGD